MRDSHIIAGVCIFAVLGVLVGVEIVQHSKQRNEAADAARLAIEATRRNSKTPATTQVVDDQKAEQLTQEQVTAEEARKAEAVAQSKIRGSISGSAWLVRKNGTSDVQRSLHVYVVGQEVGGDQIALLLKVQANHEERSANDTREIWGSSSDGKVKREEMDKADKQTEKAKKILAAIPDLPHTWTMQKAYLFCKENAPNASFAKCPQSVAVAEGKTNVDGKYIIPNIPSGDYFLYAQINTSAISAEWLIPVRIDGGEKNIDLDNDNAIELSGG